MESQTVFISYSHDNSKHRERALDLSEKLHKDNINIIIDQFTTDKRPRNRFAWVGQQIKKADFVLIVCTKKYSQSFEEKELSAEGKRRRKWMGPIINRKLYESEINRRMKKKQEDRFIPVVFNIKDVKFIPDVLISKKSYNLSSKDEYNDLVNHLKRIAPDSQKSSQSDKSSDSKVQQPTKDAPPVEQESDEPPLVETHIGGYNVPDQPVPVDSLGFEPYTTAIVNFLNHKHTQPPLTISVEGEWGSGKSSFMLQLKKKLDKPNVHIVEFSPWRHDKEEVVWAAFVLAFTDKLTKDLGWLKATIANFKLLWKRFDWQAGWPEVLKAFLKLCVYLLIIAFVFVILWTDKINFIKEMGFTSKVLLSSISLIALVVKGLRTASEFIGNPFERELRKYIDVPDSAGRISFVEKFHKDFENIEKVYAGGKRVYVFIDDLDRCEVPKAAQLMKSINLMITENSNLIFIIGLDRQKVAAGLAVKDEKLIRYLRPEGTGKKKDQIDGSSWWAGLRYGYDFIEKFIQLPFSLPRPTKSDIDNLMEDIVAKCGEKTESKVAPAPDSEKREGDDDLSVGKISEVDVVKEPEAESPDTSEPKMPKEEQKREEEKRELGLTLGDDSEQVRNIMLMAAQFLDFNPRRVKQFTNLFRLRAYIAWETNLLILPGYMEDTTGLTLEQLGKIIVISLRWPFFLESLDQDKELLKQLTDYAQSKEMNENSLTKDVAKHYAKNTQLMNLIRFGCVRGENEPDKWSCYTLSQVDIGKILQVSPKLRNMEEAIPEVVEGQDVGEKEADAEVSDKITSQDAVNVEVSSKISPSFRNKYEYNAKYILIPGGRYKYQGRIEQDMPGIYFAKYPVTNKQYRRFIRYLLDQEPDLTGILPKPEFDNRMTGLISEIEGLSDYLGSSLEDWPEKLCSNYDKDKRFKGDDQPVVGTTWYAARTYCLWLSLLEAAHRDLPYNQLLNLYRLPTAPEWEWAASGGIRKYPWASKKGPPTDKLANYNYNVGATTPVGLYPDGATSEGLMDMAGNVWEWIESNGAGDRIHRSMCGGSWVNDEFKLLCKEHIAEKSNFGTNIIGFRVVRSQS